MNVGILITTKTSFHIDLGLHVVMYNIWTICSTVSANKNKCKHGQNLHISHNICHNVTFSTILRVLCFHSEYKNL